MNDGSSVISFPRVNLLINKASLTVFYFLMENIFSQWNRRQLVYFLILFIPRLLIAKFRSDVPTDTLIVLSFSNTEMELNLTQKTIVKTYANPETPYIRSFFQFRKYLIDHKFSRSNEYLTVERPLLAGYTLGNSKRAEEKRAAYIGGLVYINQMSSFRERITLGAHIRNLNIPSRVTQEGFIEDILSELDMGTLINVRLSHGDFKDGNILVNQENNTVNLIDWELVGLRNEYHDFLNLLIHPLVHGADFIFRRQTNSLEEWLGQFPGVFGDSSKVLNHLPVTILEKASLYLNSGRWLGKEDECISGLESAWREIAPYLAFAK